MGGTKNVSNDKVLKKIETGRDSKNFWGIWWRGEMLEKSQDRLPDKGKQRITQLMSLSKLDGETGLRWNNEKTIYSEVQGTGNCGEPWTPVSWGGHDMKKNDQLTI